MIFYRLRPDHRLPAYTAGELYPFIERDRVEGYIFIQVDGRRRCAWEEHFERVDPSSPPDPSDRPQPG